MSSLLRAAVLFCFFFIASLIALIASFSIAVLLLQQLSIKLTISLLLKNAIDLLFFSEHKLYGFPQRPKSQEKNLNNLRTKRAFAVKKKTFFIIFKGLSIAKNCLRSDITSWWFTGFCFIPPEIYLFKFNNGNSRLIREICSKLIMK